METSQQSEGGNTKLERPPVERVVLNTFTNGKIAVNLIKRLGVKPAYSLEIGTPLDEGKRFGKFLRIDMYRTETHECQASLEMSTLTELVQMAIITAQQDAQVAEDAFMDRQRAFEARKAAKATAGVRSPGKTAREKASGKHKQWEHNREEKADKNRAARNRSK